MTEGTLKKAVDLDEPILVAQGQDFVLEFDRALGIRQWTDVILVDTKGFTLAVAGRNSWDGVDKLHFYCYRSGNACKIEFYA